MIPRVMLERDLFLRFDSLYEHKIKPILDKTKPDYRHLQLKSLHNHWAFWLDKISPIINNVNTTNEQTLRKEALDQLELFASQIESKMNRNENGIEALIDEPGELIKLVKYNIQEGNFRSAVSNCDHINGNFGPNLTPFSHYYKSIALFEPVKQSWIAKGLNYVLGQGENAYTSEQVQEGLKLLKKSAYLFELEIERLKAQSVILADIESNKPTIGTQGDNFTKSNTNESTALMVHLLATKFALGLDLNLDQLKLVFKHNILGEEKMKELFELVLADESMQSFVKKQRFTKKIQIRAHVDVTSENKDLLASIFPQSETIQLSNSKLVVVVDNILLGPEVKSKLVEQNVNFSYEIYVHDCVGESMKLLILPNRFKMHKKLLIKALGNESLASKNATHRAQMYDQFKQKLTIYCDNRNKIYQSLVATFGQKEQSALPTQLNENKNHTIDTKSLLNSIETNHLFKDMLFDCSAEHFVQLLSQSKFTFYSLPTPSVAISEFKENIYLCDSITRDQLARLDLSSFKNSHLLRAQIQSLVGKSLSNNDTKTKLEQLRQIITPSSHLNAQLLRNILIKNGLAKSFAHKLGFNLVNYNNEHLIKCNESIIGLFEPKLDAKQKIELDSDDFLKYLQAIGIVKCQKLRLSDNAKQSSLKMVIEECIGKRVTELVEKSIEQGVLKKRKYLVLDNRDKEIAKFKSFVSQALLSCLSPLKTSNECHIAYTDLVDSFKGINLPREVDQYKQLN
ncbi:translocase subunit secA, partial [Brachionus plicatilis]